VIDSTAIRTRYDALSPNLDEKPLRLFAASEALAAGMQEYLPFLQLPESRRARSGAV
jgi:hypothetical protein